MKTRWRPWRRSSRWENIFLEHRERIERAAQRAARKVGLPPQDVEDFVASMRLKLIDNDYAVLRKHRGQSSMSTFLITVVHNQLKDFCNQKFGKYRPSAAAKRLGPCGVALERLLVVEQLNLDSAIRILARRPDLEMSESELRQLAEELPPAKAKRHFVHEEVLETMPAAGRYQAADQRVHDRDRTQTATKLSEALNAVLKTLPAQDFLILKMNLRDGHNLATIAKRLQLPQRPLYSRHKKSLDTLRTHLESQGLSWPEIRELLEWNQDLAIAFPPIEDSGTDSQGATP